MPNIVAAWNASGIGTGFLDSPRAAGIEASDTPANRTGPEKGPGPKIRKVKELSHIRGGSDGARTRDLRRDRPSELLWMSNDAPTLREPETVPLAGEVGTLEEPLQRRSPAAGDDGANRKMQVARSELTPDTNKPNPLQPRQVRCARAGCAGAFLPRLKRGGRARLYCSTECRRAADAERKAIASNSAGQAFAEPQHLPRWPFFKGALPRPLEIEHTAGAEDELARARRRESPVKMSDDCVVLTKPELIEVYRRENGFIIRQRPATDHPTDIGRFVALTPVCAARVLRLLSELYLRKDLIRSTD